MPTLWRKGGVHDDRGMGLVLVIGMTFTLALIVAASMSVAVGSLTSSRLHVDYDTSLDAAETGLDSTLGLVQTANNSGGAYSTQATDAADLSLDPVCRAYWASPPATQYWNAGWETTPPTPAQETAWARAAFAGIPNQCLRNAGQGQYLSFRYQNSAGKLFPVVYAIGWSPSKAQDAVGRILKVDFVFSRYTPSFAILAEDNTALSGDLAFTGNDTVGLVSGSTATAANIHSNGNITSTGTALDVNPGSVSAVAGITTCPPAGTITITSPGTCSGSATAQTVPPVAAGTLYKSLSGSMPNAWYDLCPDGTVKRPDPASLTPCAGTFISNPPYNGWTISGMPCGGTTPCVWTSTAPLPGTYYVYQANVNLTSATASGLTVIAEDKPTGGPVGACSKSGGDIVFSGANITGPKMPGLLLIADGQLTATTATTVGHPGPPAAAGLLAAGDNVSLTAPSGATSITGAVISNNTCTARGGTNLSRTDLLFDALTPVPLSTTVRTNAWRELTG